jgi:RNA polymerase sigma factor (sigma-70 family)
VTGEHQRQPSVRERIAASLPGLTRFVRGQMSPEMRARESASDIVQSTFRSLLLGGGAFEDRGEASFQGWLRTAARNKLRSRARQWSAQRCGVTPEPIDAGAAAGEQTEPAAPGSADPSQEAVLREEVERLRRAFAALPPDQREVLVRSQVRGECHAEIARATGRTPDAVRKSVARALARLSAGLNA